MAVPASICPGTTPTVGDYGLCSWNSKDDVLIVDGQLDNLSRAEIKNDFEPDFTVVSAQLSVWRCAPPELRVPKKAILDLKTVGRGCCWSPAPTTPPKRL